MTLAQKKHELHRSFKTLQAVLSANFVDAVLFVLPVRSAGVAVSFADRQLLNWIDFMRRSAGAAVRYVRITKYGPDSQILQYCIIADLPISVCSNLAATWLLGSATVQRVSGNEIPSFVGEMMQTQSTTRAKNRRTWSASHTIHRTGGCHSLPIPTRAPQRVQIGHNPPEHCQVPVAYPPRW